MLSYLRTQTVLLSSILEVCLAQGLPNARPVINNCLINKRYLLQKANHHLQGQGGRMDLPAEGIKPYFYSDILHIDCGGD